MTEYASEPARSNPELAGTARATPTSPPVSADEVAGVIEARRTLGPGNDNAIIAGFLQQVGHTIDDHVDRRLAEKASPAQADEYAIWITLGSIGLGIPVTGVLTSLPMPASAIVILLVWTAITLINVAYYRRKR